MFKFMLLLLLLLGYVISCVLVITCKTKSVLNLSFK